MGLPHVVLGCGFTTYCFGVWVYHLSFRRGALSFLHGEVRCGASTSIDCEGRWERESPSPSDFASFATIPFVGFVGQSPVGLLTLGMFLSWCFAMGVCILCPCIYLPLGVAGVFVYLVVARKGGVVPQ